MYRFFYHFNKPMTKKTGEVFWTLHFRQKCYIVRDIQCMVPTNTKPNRRQPLGVVQGFCKDVKIVNDVAVVS